MIEPHELAPVPAVDGRAADAARDLVTGPDTRWGQLEAWVSWVAGVRSQCPPSPFHAVRVASVGAKTPPLPSALVFRPGVVVEPLEPGDDVAAALDAGRRWADAAADVGVELIVPVVASTEASLTAAATAVAVLAGTEPVWALGFDTDLDDQPWMRVCAGVRDGAWRLRNTARADLLPALGEPTLAATAGLLHQAAARRTPVLLDGAVVAAAALVAHRIDGEAKSWWFAPHRDQTATERVALDMLGLDPVASLGLRSASAGGLGTLTLLPSMLAALDALAR